MAPLPHRTSTAVASAGIEERTALGREPDRTLVTATAAPENMRSLCGLMPEGFTVRRYAVLYGGLAQGLQGTRCWRDAARRWLVDDA